MDWTDVAILSEPPTLIDQGGRTGPDMSEPSAPSSWDNHQTHEGGQVPDICLGTCRQISYKIVILHTGVALGNWTVRHILGTER